VHQLVDDRYPEIYTYVRRPGYYAAFNAGKQISVHHLQRFGLGLVWTDSARAVLQSQGGSADAAWGTAADGAPQVYEAGQVEAVFRVAGKSIEPKPGSMDLPPGALTITYPLGGRGEKSMEFTADAIVVRVRHEGAFTEFIPLLDRGEDSGFALKFDPPATATKAESAAGRGGRRLTVTRLAAKDALTYRLEIAR